MSQTQKPLTTLKQSKDCMKSQWPLKVKICMHGGRKNSPMLKVGDRMLHILG